MNIDKIAIVGDDDGENVQDTIRRMAGKCWEKIQALRAAGHTVKHSISVGFDCSFEDAVKQLESAFTDMIQNKLVNTIEIVDGENVCKIYFAEYLRAASVDAQLDHDLVVFSKRDVGTLPWDQLGNADTLFRDAPVPQSTRGKSNIMQSMTLLALHHAFGMDAGRPQPTRFSGNNAATTILGNIGRRKPRGK